MATVSVAVLVLMSAPGARAQTLGFVLTPNHGPVGTLVHFEGDVDISEVDAYRHPIGYGLVGSTPDGCEIIVDLEGLTTTVSDTGHVVGSFVVGAGVSGCFMRTDLAPPSSVPPGTYAVHLQCHGCAVVAEFRISSRGLARTGQPLGQLALLGLGLVTTGALLLVSSHKRATTLPVGS